MIHHIYSIFEEKCRMYNVHTTDSIISMIAVNLEYIIDIELYDGLYVNIILSNIKNYKQLSEQIEKLEDIYVHNNIKSNKYYLNVNGDLNYDTNNDITSSIKYLQDEQKVILDICAEQIISNYNNIYKIVIKETLKSINRIDNDQYVYRYIFMKNGVLHNINDYAVCLVENEQYKSVFYYIDGEILSSEQWNKHPKRRIQKIKKLKNVKEN